jgi:uncharacterized protein (DUF362 family)
MAKSTVAVRRVEEYDPGLVAESIGALIDSLGGWGRFVRPGDRVLVKPNMVSASPPEHISMTHPVVTAEICRALKDYGTRPFVGDSPGWGSMAGNSRKAGLTPLLEHLGVELVDLSRPNKVANPHGRVYDRLTLDASALEADAIINVPKFKTHRQLFMTIAIKNMFGCVCGKRKAWWHVKAGNYENYFALMLVETFALLKPALTIIDAVVSMEGNGPVRGTPRRMSMMLASDDGAALEWVGCELVGARPEQLRVLQAARELGLGATNLDQIEIVGGTLDEFRVPDFVFPKPMPIGFSLPRVVKSTLKNAWLVHTERITDRAQAAR